MPKDGKQRIWVSEFLVRMRGYDPDKMEEEEYNFIATLSYKMFAKSFRASPFGGGI